MLVKNSFKLIEKEKMKSVIGGNVKAWCRATAKCKNGSTIALTCENAESGCVGADAGFPGYSGDGYAHCYENGNIQVKVCQATVS